MKNVYQFLSYNFEILFDNAEMMPYGAIVQIKYGDTPAKCYFQVFFKIPVFSKTGARLWMKLVEMEENGM